MKRILFIFISFLFYMDGMAQETQIQLYKENVDDWVKDDRSLPIMPTATHDGNIISIYSDMPIEKLEIAIKGYIQKHHSFGHYYRLLKMSYI